MDILPVRNDECLSQAKRVACKLMGVSVRCDCCVSWRPEVGRTAATAVVGFCQVQVGNTGCSQACKDFEPRTRE